MLGRAKKLVEMITQPRYQVRFATGLFEPVEIAAGF